MRVVIAVALALLGLGLLLSHMGSIEGPRVGFGSDENILNTLSYIPDNENSRSIAAVNLYELASSSLDLEVPDSNATDVVVDYAFYLKTQGGMEKGPLISGLDDAYTITLSVMRDNAGYDLRDLSASVWAGLGNEVYSAVVFKRNVPQLSNKMRTSPVWPSPEARTYHGTQILSWGEELQADAVQQFNPPVYNQLGQPARIGFMRRGLMSALRASQLEEMIDAKVGGDSSLADNLLYQNLAAGAESLALYSIVFSSRTQSFQSASDYLRRITVMDDEFEQKKSELAAEPMLVPYEAFATGIGKDQLGRFYMGLVLVHEDELLARQNLEHIKTRLSGEGVSSWKKPWNELFRLDLAEYAVQGNTLLAKIPFEENRASNIWKDWFYSQDYLILHQ